MSGIIISLGNQNDESGYLLSIAQNRLNKTIGLWKKYPDFKIIPTGGFGKHFNTTSRPHGEYAREYLIKQGIPKEQILEVVQSSNTFEDALLSIEVIKQVGPRKIYVVTSWSHMLRARLVFKKIYKRKINVIGSKDTNIVNYLKEFQTLIKILFGLIKIPNNE